VRMIGWGGDIYLAVPVCGSMEDALTAIGTLDDPPYLLRVTVGRRGIYICARFADVLAASIDVETDSTISA
jgi:hypothetical protein